MIEDGVETNYQPEFNEIRLNTKGQLVRYGRNGSHQLHQEVIEKQEVQSDLTVKLVRIYAYSDQSPSWEIVTVVPIFGTGVLEHVLAAKELFNEAAAREYYEQLLDWYGWSNGGG